MVFLTAVTSAQSELQALSVRHPCLQILQDKVILGTDQAFLPKVASAFHRCQDIVLPSFCNKPSNNKEQQLHLLDVRRCLLSYLETTKSFRTSETFFLFSQEFQKGKQASKRTIARWIKAAISEA